MRRGYSLHKGTKLKGTKQLKFVCLRVKEHQRVNRSDFMMGVCYQPPNNKK